MMKKKVLALTLAAFVACGAAGCGGEEKKPAPKPENKQTTNVKKDEKQKAPEKKVDPAVKHAQEVMKLPHVAKYDKMSKDAYPHLKWGSTGYSYKDYPGKGKEGKGALIAYGEVIAGFHRTLASDDRPTFKLDDGREVKGSENYDIEVLVGGCKGNCVIEAKNRTLRKKYWYPLTKPMCVTMKTARSGLPTKNAERNNYYGPWTV